MMSLTFLRRSKGALIFLAIVMMAGCSVAPVTGRRQLNVISGAQEMQLGLSSFDQLKKETPISKNASANALLQKVGRQIAEAAKNDLPNAQWEFVVFESKEANAFCLPGGKVGVYTGLLPITQNEAGLATVIGHEVAHAAAHHGAERMSQQLATQAGGQALGVALSNSKYAQLAAMAYPVVSQVGVLLPFSRQQESEADRIGLSYMARAGYDPKAAIAFWERFMKYNQAGGAASTPGWLRTHPLDQDRINNIKQWLPQVQAEVQSAPQR